MLTEENILNTLDNVYAIGTYWRFPTLGDPYSYLIDCRLNVFIGQIDEWAIIVERLGYSPRSGVIELELINQGNCLTNLENYNGETLNSYSVLPIDDTSFYSSSDGFSINATAECWLVKGNELRLSVNTDDYLQAGIKLTEPDKIRVEEAARLLIIKNRIFFRASDGELCKFLPSGMKKILVLDDWHHKDFLQIKEGNFSTKKLSEIYHFNKSLTGLAGLDLAEFSALYQSQLSKNQQFNTTEFADNRPSSYETWQQIAKVIINRVPDFYNPTLPSNTHWKNWPESGSL